MSEHSNKLRRYREARKKHFLLRETLERARREHIAKAADVLEAGMLVEFEDVKAGLGVSYGVLTSVSHEDINTIGPFVNVSGFGSVAIESINRVVEGALQSADKTLNARKCRLGIE